MVKVTTNVDGVGDVMNWPIPHESSHYHGSVAQYFYSSITIDNASSVISHQEMHVGWSFSAVALSQADSIVQYECLFPADQIVVAPCILCCV